MAYSSPRVSTILMSIAGTAAASAATAVAMHLRDPAEEPPTQASILKFGAFQFEALVLRIHHPNTQPSGDGIVTTFAMKGIHLDCKEEVTGDLRAQFSVSSIYVSEVCTV